MAKAVVLCALLFVVSACGAAERRSSGDRTPQATTTAESPPDSRAAGIYTYDQAKQLGIPVPAIPPAAELCHPTPDDGFDGFTLEELDGPDVQAADNAPTCWADPRSALYSIGYSVEAVRDAPTAYLKGQIICAPSPLSRGEELRDPRSMLSGAVGVKPTDDVDELVRGCASAQASRDDGSK